MAAAFIQPADMPCVPPAVIGELAAAHEAGWNVAPRFEGQRGHPVLLDRANWGAMLALPADARPRDALRAARLRLVDVEDAGVVLDVDTREAYERADGARMNRARTSSILALMLFVLSYWTSQSTDKRGPAPENCEGQTSMRMTWR